MLSEIRTALMRTPRITVKHGIYWIMFSCKTFQHSGVCYSSIVPHGCSMEISRNISFCLWRYHHRKELRRNCKYISNVCILIWVSIFNVSTHNTSDFNWIVLLILIGTLTCQSDGQGHVSSWGSSPIKLSAEFNQDLCHILSPVPLPESDQLMSVLIEQQTSQRLFIDYLLASWRWHCKMFPYLQSVLLKLSSKIKLVRQILLHFLFPFNEFNYMCLTDFLMLTKKIQNFIWRTVKKTLDINYSTRNYPEGSVYWCNFRHGNEDTISWLEFSTPLSRGIGVFFLLTGLYLLLWLCSKSPKKQPPPLGPQQ